MMTITQKIKTFAWDRSHKQVVYGFAGLIIIFSLVGFFDKALAAGLLLLLFLTFATFTGMYLGGLRDKNIYYVFLAGALIHVGAAMFIYYGHFKPFGGGADYEGYNQIAIEIARRFWHGNFSFAGLYTDHFFPILIGLVYMVAFPGMIVGQLFVAWLAGISVVLAYLLALYIGATKKSALAAGLIILGYPSYLYFGSLLLKDTVVIPLVLGGLVLTVMMVNRFSWTKFLLLFFTLTCLINLRFYIGYALMLAFILSWPVLSNFPIKKRMLYWFAMIILLGFSSYLVGNGYYGFNSLYKLLNPKSITYYREVVYSVNSPLNVQPIAPSDPNQPIDKKPVDNGSTFVIETGLKKGPLVFLKNSFQSFSYSLLGPFPWQFSQKRQIVGLAETIPWYILIIGFIYLSGKYIIANGAMSWVRWYKLGLPLILFSILALGALSLYINNYGIIARIRIPSLICLVILMSVIFNDSIEKLWQKISQKNI